MNITDLAPDVITPFNIQSIYESAAMFSRLYVENDNPELYAALADMRNTL
jgi:hypothetical protein